MKLGLGTVQFGQAYGVSNKHGQVPRSEARAILARAAQAGVIQAKKIRQIAKPRMNAARRFTRVQPIYRDLAGIRCFERRHAAQKCGLARAIGPDQGGDRTRFDRQADPMQRPVAGILED